MSRFYSTAIRVSFAVFDVQGRVEFFHRHDAQPGRMLNFVGCSVIRPSTSASPFHQIAKAHAALASVGATYGEEGAEDSFS